MTFYCCKYDDTNGDHIYHYLRTKNELNDVCRSARRNGFKPKKSVITVSDDLTRTETAIR